MPNARFVPARHCVALFVGIAWFGGATVAIGQAVEWRTAKKALARHDSSLAQPEEEAPPPRPQPRPAPQPAPAVARPAPLARLVENPDQTAGSPPYALTDQAGTVQRYVEPVPGIDLAAYVGQVVAVRSDTGPTLLATQLDLPPRPLRPLVGDATPNPAWTQVGLPIVPARRPMRNFAVQQAQYVDNDDSTVELLPEEMPMPPDSGGSPRVEMLGDANYGVYPGPMMPGGMCGPQGCGPQYCDPMLAGPGMMQPYVGPMLGPCPQCGGYHDRSANSYGCGNPCGDTCMTGTCSGQCDPCGRCGPRFSIFADFLYLQPIDADVTHAQQQDGLGGAGTVPFGEIGTVGVDFDSGIRFGGAVNCGPCSSVVVTYSFFESAAEDTLSAPVIPAGVGAVGSLVHHPGTALTASVGPVSADYDIEFQIGDALFRHQFLCGDRYTVNFLIGAQLGHLEQGFKQMGVFAGGNAGAIRTTTEINFDGGGLKAGFDTARQLGGGVSLYGRVTAAAMQGEFQGHYTMLNTTTTTLLANADWSDSRIVPQLEYEAGVVWSRDHLRLSAGYMVSQWLNTVTTDEFIDAVQADNYVNVGDSITFAGLVARVGCGW